MSLCIFGCKFKYKLYFRENDRLKEQLRKYMSAVESGIAMKTGSGDSEEVTQYERKLVQVYIVIYCSSLQYFWQILLKFTLS